MPSVTTGNVITSTAQIGDGVIVDADINASAAIAKTKLAALHIVDADIDAHTTSKITVPSTLLSVASQAQGDILYFNGTNWVRLAPGTSGQFLKTLGAAANPLWAATAISIGSGQVSKVGADADTSQTIAHGLGVTPSYVSFNYGGDSDGSLAACIGHGQYNGTNQQAIVWTTDPTAANDKFLQSTTQAILLRGNPTSGGQAGVVTFDATNITITWTKVGTGSNNTFYINWVAMK